MKCITGCLIIAACCCHQVSYMHANLFEARTSYVGSSSPHHLPMLKRAIAIGNRLDGNNAESSRGRVLIVLTDHAKYETVCMCHFFCTFQRFFRGCSHFFFILFLQSLIRLLPSAEALAGAASSGRAWLIALPESGSCKGRG